MKKVIPTFLIFFLSSFLMAQPNLYSFLDKNAEMICALAHPSVDYRGKEISAGYSSYIMKIYYFNSFSEVNHTLRLKIGMDSDGWPSSLEVISDTALFSPFEANGLIKAAALTIARDAVLEDINKKGRASSGQRELLELIGQADNLSSREYAFLIIMLNWVNYLS